MLAAGAGLKLSDFFFFFFFFFFLRGGGGGGGVGRRGLPGNEKVFFSAIIP